MMFSGSRGANSHGIFKWKWQGQSSLTAGLLDDLPHEIELSDYGRVPSPGSESPSGLLNGESLNVEPIADLDLFFEKLYSYYCEKGLWCIIIKWVVELLSLGFTICFSGFFLLFVDWNGLRNAKCGMDAIESGMKPCDLAKEALHSHPFFAQLRETLGIRHFYYNSLRVTDNEIQTMPWATILEKVVQLQSSERLCVVKNLSAHDVVMRLMRKENYLIGMLNKGVLAFPISQWVPGAGPTVKFGLNGKRHRLILTKTLEWTLNWCILQSMFDRNFCVRRDFISNPRTLKKRLMVVGLAMLLLSPFIVIFMLVYLFLRHAEQFYNHPSTASSRRWSNLSKWIFREFNEFISFVSGGFAAILIIIAFLEESLLEGHIFGRNLLWYAAVFGTITAISRAAVTDELLVLDPEGAMSMVVQHTHYMPKTWRGKENTETVRIEFETLFQYTGMMLLEEMASIFLTPYLLLFVVPKRVEDILQFIADFTEHVDGVGDVCSFSAFDFQKHGNSNYGSPYNASRTQRSSQGKMEKSFLSFQSSYPSWESNSEGKQFLLNLRTFREQKMQQGHVTRVPYSPPRMWQGSPNLRGHGDRFNILSRDMPQYSPGTGYHLGSLWLIDADQKNHPYLLDWYYTSQPHHPTNYSRDIEEPTEATERQFGDFWNPSNLTPNNARYEDFLEQQAPNNGRHGDYLMQQYDFRSRSSLGASTSAPFFRESDIENQEQGNLVHPAKSHWWARNGPQGVQPQASFLEPPDFNRRDSVNYYDNLSERSTEEQDQHLDWRNSRKLSQTTYVDDLDMGGCNLHFDDIYSRPPETPRIDPEASHFE
ncbi:Autophagy-related protein [Trema orientale]|uniref:Autophagy-related protein 9 n=1 Tax=Trema orientale TaxID=63057 RepID=A0A2P5E834_TREOI|nr:Autophagy-related protein [Trema orientale]